MIRRTPEGGITTTDEQVMHHFYPCPPSRDPQVSCEDAWRRYAARSGRTLIVEKEQPRGE